MKIIQNMKYGERQKKKGGNGLGKGELGISMSIRVSCIENFKVDIYSC